MYIKSMDFIIFYKLSKFETLFKNSMDKETIKLSRKFINLAFIKFCLSVEE